MRVHEVKCDIKYYYRVAGGTKSWELRLDDRGYKVGDLLLLRNWVTFESGEAYYGSEWCLKRIDQIDTPDGLQIGWVVLSLSNDVQHGREDV